jgi:phosphoribosylglycinamide formyltransferase-1
MKIRPRNRRIGILLSGRGSNFEAIAANVASGKLRAEIAVVISNVESAPGLARAKERGLNAVCIPSKGKAREAFDAELRTALERVRCGAGGAGRIHADLQPGDA